jgi:hypothetical protein
VIADKFIAQYIGSVKAEIEDVKNALSSGLHADMYSVGRLQGKVDGLKAALQLLEADLESQDV